MIARLHTWGISISRSPSFLIRPIRSVGIFRMNVRQLRAGSVCVSVVLLMAVWPVSFRCEATDQQGGSAARSGSHRLPEGSQAASDAAMRKFVASLKDQDVKVFLTLFSRRQPWRYVGTITEPHQVSIVRYSELARDLRKKTGWYETLFEAEGLDCFRDHIVSSEGKMWKRILDNKFIPPNDEGDGRVYVKWRRERGSWVVDEIAEPAS